MHKTTGGATEANTKYFQYGPECDIFGEYYFRSNLFVYEHEREDISVYTATLRMRDHYGVMSDQSWGSGLGSP